MLLRRRSRIEKDDVQASLLIKLTADVSIERRRIRKKQVAIIILIACDSFAEHYSKRAMKCLLATEGEAASHVLMIVARTETNKYTLRTKVKTRGCK